MLQSRVKRIKFLDLKLGPMIALLLEKGVIAFFRNVDPYFETIKVRMTRNIRLYACTCEIVSEYILAYSLFFNPSTLYKNFLGLDVTIQ